MLVVYYPLSIREAAYALRGEFVSEFVRRGERWNKRVAQGTWSTEVVCPAITSIESMPRVALLVKRFKWVIIIAAVLMAIVSTSLLLGVASPAMADPTDVGYRDFSFGTRASSPTADKPQSKLWFNDGIWWGSLWNASTNRWEIYRFNWSAHTWSSTGTPLETRANSKADTLWDGTHLYVATAPRSTSSTDQNAYVRRYGYDAATKKYTLNSGFPAQVATGIMEAIVLDKDTTGKLWVTYAQGSKIYVNRSLGSDSTWGTPFVLPVPGTTVDPDDISALVSFDRQNAPPKIGVMWSNQVDNAMYFATHIDGDPDDVWQPPRVAIGGPNSRYADDHINLKSLQADSSGRVFAAVKTSLTSPDAPLTLLLALQQDDAWSSHVFGRVQDDHTRPMVLIDETHRELYMFATAPVSPGGTIYYKKTGLDNISFEQGLGTPFVKSSTDTTINNATSTKQNLNANTGLLVLASDDTSDYYLHNTIDLADVDTTAPETTIDSGPSGTVNNTSASFAFSSNEAGSSFECSLDGAAFASCSSPQSYDNLSDGSHTFDVRAKDAAGNTDATPASCSWTVGTADTTAPETIIDSGPSGTITVADATFTFSSEAGATFECRLDGAAYSACNSPKSYTNLSNGSHTFDVRATDGAGNVDATPASRTFTVDVPPPPLDTTPPQTTINSGPSGTIKQNNATFSFSSSEANSTFECKLDSAAFSACSSPKKYTGLATGSHTFQVRATDAAGNTDASPASRTWTVR